MTFVFAAAGAVVLTEIGLIPPVFMSVVSRVASRAIATSDLLEREAAERAELPDDPRDLIGVHARADRERRGAHLDREVGAGAGGRPGLQKLDALRLAARRDLHGDGHGPRPGAGRGDATGGVVVLDAPLVRRRAALHPRDPRRDRHQAATVPFSVGDGFEIVSVPLLTD